MKLLLDELYSKKIAQKLRARGHDVCAVTEDPALIGLSDYELIERMVEDHRVIVTNNVADFASLVKSKEHAGLVFTSDKSLPRNRKTVGLFIRRLDSLLSSHTEENALHGQIRWLDP